MAPDNGIYRQAALEQTIRSLEMSPAGVDMFFRRILDFCSGHNAEKHYSHVVDMMADCVVVHRRVLATVPVRT